MHDLSSYFHAKIATQLYKIILNTDNDNNNDNDNNFLYLQITKW